MPTQSTTYNTRLTDEALEKRFRDTFRSQGGAELVDDLYASGVIVPVVDFTAAAEGSFLRQDLQTAWDYSTDSQESENSTDTIISTTGFWLIDSTVSATPGTGTTKRAFMQLVRSGTPKDLFRVVIPQSTAGNVVFELSNPLIVFVRAGETVRQGSTAADCVMHSVFRQIADVNGNFTNPRGFQFT